MYFGGSRVTPKVTPEKATVPPSHKKSKSNSKTTISQRRPPFFTLPKRTAPAYHQGEQEPAATGSAAIIAAPSPLPCPGRHGFTLRVPPDRPGPVRGSSSRSARGVHRGWRSSRDKPIGRRNVPASRRWRTTERKKDGGGRRVLPSVSYSVPGCAGVRNARGLPDIGPVNSVVNQRLTEEKRPQQRL